METSTLTSVLMKRVQAPSYAIVMIAILCSLTGGSLLLWQLSGTSYFNTISMFLTFALWQFTVITSSRIAANRRTKHTDTSTYRELLTKLTTDTNRLKTHGGVGQIALYVLGLSICYVALNGCLHWLFTAITAMNWVGALALGLLLSGLVIAPWLWVDARAALNSELVVTHEE